MSPDKMTQMHDPKPKQTWAVLTYQRQPRSPLKLTWQTQNWVDLESTWPDKMTQIRDQKPNNK
jgi:hypothetical protein